MEQKINIAELLKDCPSGMELDCTMFEGIEFDSIVNNDCFPILCRMKNSNDKYNFYSFTKYGYWNDDYRAKCVIFPKGKTTWEGFVPPCQFKDGDIVYIKTKGYNQNEFIIIFKEIKNDHIHKYACFAYQILYTNKNAVCHLVDVEVMRLATEEEKEKLFDAIKANGYKWNAETKTLEKLPKFKVGDKVKRKEVNYTYIVTIAEIDEEYYTYVNQNGEPASISIKNQDEWELVPNKFDITTLIPFESRVLVRNTDCDIWRPAIYGFTDSDKCYVVGGVSWKQCIPYEANKELLGTTNNLE